MLYDFIVMEYVRTGKSSVATEIILASLRAENGGENVVSIIES